MTIQFISVLIAIAVIIVAGILGVIYNIKSQLNKRSYSLSDFPIIDKLEESDIIPVMIIDKRTGYYFNRNIKFKDLKKCIKKELANAKK